MEQLRLEDIAPFKQGKCLDEKDIWLLNLDMVESNTGKILDYLLVLKEEIGSSTIIFDCNNVLYSKLRPYLNKVVLPDRCGYATSEMIPLMPNQDIVTREYLTYFLRSPGFVEYINSKTAGAKMPRANTKVLKDILVPCPSIEKQNSIVTQLEKIQAVIELKKQQLEQLDLLIKARFVEMFGDISTGNYRYDTKKLGNVAKVGSSHRVFTTEFVESGIPFYRGTEIGELANGKIPAELFYISEAHYERLAIDDTKPQVGDLLMPSICNKGQVWMVDTEEPFYYKDGRVLCISPNRNMFDCKYLEYFMRAKTLVEYPKLGSGSTFAEFKIFLLKDIDVLIPPIELQEQFADFVTQVDKSKLQKEISLPLLSKAFSAT